MASGRGLGRDTHRKTGSAAAVLHSPGKGRVRRRGQGGIVVAEKARRAHAAGREGRCAGVLEDDLVGGHGVVGPSSEGAVTGQRKTTLLALSLAEKRSAANGRGHGPSHPSATAGGEKPAGRVSLGKARRVRGRGWAVERGPDEAMVVVSAADERAAPGRQDRGGSLMLGRNFLQIKG